MVQGGEKIIGGTRPLPPTSRMYGKNILFVFWIGYHGPNHSFENVQLQ